MRRLLERRLIAVLVCTILPGTVHSEGISGAAIYEQQCARCHGARGEGTEENYPNPLTGNSSIAQLAKLIAETMPADMDQKCPPAEAQAVAEFIYNAFYSPEAQFRDKPARVELSRLTIRQHQNAVTDLIGSFRKPREPSGKRGLVGRYFAGRGFRPDRMKIERIDPQVQFDFGTAAPDPEKFEAHSFSVSWEGSILAPDTGDYEFIVRTDHATRLYVNNSTIPLIDAWVKSDNDNEYRADIRLLGGRRYPITLEFSKAIQGVGDSRKPDEPKPLVPASVVFAWKRLHHTTETVMPHFLSTAGAPETFVLHTQFPPDDRSVGYERGTAISKAWDDATTEAAIEVASYVMEHLPELSGTVKGSPDLEPRLIDFCHTFAERAFRRPLTDEQRLMYVDQQFASARDPELAVKRVLLLVLKSPRFLYREVCGAQEDNSYDIASRMTFDLWDSIPDESLRQAAAAGDLGERTEVLQQLTRMVNDAQTHAKLRAFLMTWLKVSQPPTVVKDPTVYPEFTEETVSDLRTSLELAIDDLLDSETANYRDLLLDESIYVNGRLASIYGAQLPKDAPFEKVVGQIPHRSGMLSHPYLLACLAYSNASSPIHRGVFLTRNMLGQALRQPPEAVAPLPVELHAELTTRERVTLQTQPQACQSCHSVINPLGFSLEEFDAIGRYREAEKNRPVNASGSYTTESGQVVEFDGVRELAAFLANSEESQAAFVEQMFQYFVKQPLRAYGPDCGAQLQRSFAANEFNIKKLAVEIVAASALPAD